MNNVIIPQVHINGTSQGELIQQVSNVNNALNHLLETLAQMAPNGRDYYHTGNFNAAREAHAARVQAVIDLQNEIMAIGEGIADQ